MLHQNLDGIGLAKKVHSDISITSLNKPKRVFWPTQSFAGQFWLSTGVTCQISEGIWDGMKNLGELVYMFIWHDVGDAWETGFSSPHHHAVFGPPCHLLAGYSHFLHAGLGIP